MELPTPIAAYFAAELGHDGDAVVAPFAADAVVGDEAAQHTGHAEIKAWWAKAQAEYSQTTEVLDASNEGDVTTVHCRVTGTFPQSPILLDFRFTVTGGLIARLEIR